MVASQNGHLDVVNKLLQQGARIDLQAKVSMLHATVPKHLIMTGWKESTTVCISERTC